MVQGKKSVMADGQDAAKVVVYPPLWSATLNSEGDSEIRKASWFKQKLYDVGIFDMSGSPKDTGIRLNYSTAIFYIMLLTAVAGGWVWTWQTAKQVGIDQQKIADDQEKQNMLIEQMKQQIISAQADAAEAKKFGIYAAAGADEQNGHKPNQQKQEKK
jgi:hypothetical protein